MASQSIQINKTAVYHTYGNPNKASHIIFVLHGYGQLAEYFIRKFHQLPESYFIVAPEGFHRFYLKGSSGRVGASWMTKERREDDIKDNINYLNQLWNTLETNYQFEQKILLGFSQGGATAARWHAKGNFNADQFILWASVFPPDLEQEWSTRFLKSFNTFVIGDEDEYYTTEKIKQQEQYFKDFEVNFHTQHYHGNHNIDPQTLNSVLK